MFHDATTFNQDIGSWNVVRVTNMDAMFSGAASFCHDISSWDVSSVISKKNIFRGTHHSQKPEFRKNMSFETT
jgi:surface protein